MIRAARSGRAIGAVLAVLALSAAAAAPAVADSASAVQGVSLAGVGCASDGTCWAAGTNRQQTAGVLVPISDGKPGSPKQISGTSQLTGVACETPTSCVAVGQQAGNPSSGVMVPITNGVPGSAEPVAGAYGLSGVACATSAGCVAVGGGSPQAGGNEEGVVVPISGLTPGAPRFLSAFLSDVACQDASHCFAVGENSTGGTTAVVAITDGQPGSAQTVGQPNPATSVALFGVACAPGTTSCLAVGEQLTPPSPTGPGRPAQGVAVPISNGTVGAVDTVSSVAHFFRVACKSATSCLAAGSVTSGFSLGRLVPIDVGGSAGAAKSETPGLFGVACWSAASCVAVGGEDVFLIGSATPSRAVVTAAVANALAVTGRAGRISAIVRAGGYRAGVSAPEAGKLKVTWYFLPRGAHLARKVKPIVVARGAKTFTAAGSATLRLRLTSQGRALLKHAKRIKLTAVGSFAPTTAATVSKHRSITLKTH